MFKLQPVTLQALYQMLVTVALAVLGYVVHKTDPSTFQMIVGALIVQVTGGTIHLGQQTTSAQKATNGGSQAP